MEAPQTGSLETQKIQARGGLQQLPVFRPVALKLLRLFTDEDVDVQRVAGLLRTDPGLSAQLLALANSPVYGNSHRVDSLPRALIILGFEKARSLTLTVAVRSLVRDGRRIKASESCWQHSLATALLAEELAPLYQVSKDEAYMAALMHDIGRLGLLMAYGEHYAPLLEATYRTIADSLASEYALFGMDHCQAGLWLTQRWGFPPEYSRVAGCHHEDLPGRSGDLASLTRLACALADALNFGAVKVSGRASVADLVAQLPSSAWTPFRFDEEEAGKRIAAHIAAIEAQ